MHSGVVLCFYVEARWRFPCLSSFLLTGMQAWWLTLRQPSSWEAAILGGSHLGPWGGSSCKVRQSNETEWAWSLTLMHTSACLWAFLVGNRNKLWSSLLLLLRFLTPQSHDSCCLWRLSLWSLSVLIPLEPQYYCRVTLTSQAQPWLMAFACALLCLEHLFPAFLPRVFNTQWKQLFLKEKKILFLYTLLSVIIMSHHSNSNQ